MVQWEYHVIHLNVEGPNPSAPSPPAGTAAAGTQTAAKAEPVFSKKYLEKEFPAFYGGEAAQSGTASQHPAQQLRGFLNSQGRDGWELLGIFPVGRLAMMIFKRPMASAEPAPEEPQAEPSSGSGS